VGLDGDGCNASNAIEGGAVKKSMMLLLVGLGLAGCGGGGGSSSPQAPSTPAVTPATTIEATGAGYLTVHPSAASGFAVAIEVPIRIRETGGGTADFNWARLSLFRNGVEIERKEIGSDTIRAAGFSRIAANQNQTYSLTYRFNSSDFDVFTVSLGFADLKDARQFTAQIPNTSFSGVNLSLTPLANPGPPVRLGH
jgi:hypothetical protein